MRRSSKYPNQIFKILRNACLSFVILLNFTAVGFSQASTSLSNLSSVRLRTKPWRESAYGLSLRPPINTKLIEHSADDASLRIIAHAGYMINLFIKQTKAQQHIDIDSVLAASIKQMGTVHLDASILEQKKLQIASHPAALIAFFVPSTRQGPWVTRELFIHLSVGTLAVLRLETPQAKYKQARSVFQAVIDSIQIQDPKQLAQARKKLTENTLQWKDQISSEQYQQALVKEQWFRMIEKNLDIGYLRIQMHHGKLDNRVKDSTAPIAMTGIQIDVQSRITIAQRTFDTLSNFFLTDDQDTEIWSIKTTERNPKKRQVKTFDRRGNHLTKTDTINTWVETGLRSKQKITVDRYGPQGTKTFHWEIPNVYISQVQLYLLHAVLPKNKPKTFGFYAYYPNIGKIGFRTERLEPRDNGQIRIYSTPLLDEATQITDYDFTGKITRRQLPSNRQLIPSTLREISALWGVSIFQKKRH